MKVFWIVVAIVVALLAAVPVGIFTWISRGRAANDRLAWEGHKIVTAIEEFRNVSGRSPTNLAELVPDFLGAIPPGSGFSEWHYDRTYFGYSLRCKGRLGHCSVCYTYFADEPEHSLWEENWEGTRRRIEIPTQAKHIEHVPEDTARGLADPRH